MSSVQVRSSSRSLRSISSLTSRFDRLPCRTTLQSVRSWQALSPPLVSTSGVRLTTGNSLSRLNRWGDSCQSRAGAETGRSSLVSFRLLELFAPLSRPVVDSQSKRLGRLERLRRLGRLCGESHTGCQTRCCNRHPRADTWGVKFRTTGPTRHAGAGAGVVQTAAEFCQHPNPVLNQASAA